MAHRGIRTHLIRQAAALLAVPSAMFATVAPPQAHADTVAYLVNVTVWPGYGFAGPDDALAYGNGICHKLAQGRTYGEVMADVKSDFRTSDEFHASYLIGQAADNLCPVSINALRTSAGGYRPPAPAPANGE